MNSLIENIDKLIKGTKEGKITWEPLNKIYIWKTKNDEGKAMSVVLQPTLVNGKITKILFRLWDIESKSALINLYTDSSSEIIKNKISELYDTVKDYENLRKVDVLSNLLKNI